MSYLIMYDRQFIKSSHGITPCILSGYSNVYTPSLKGREHRVRDWCVFGGKLVTSEEELLEAVQPWLGGYNEHWKQNGKWVTDDILIRWIKSSCRNAATIEDIIRVNGFHFGILCYVTLATRETSDGLSNWSHALQTRVSTTEEFDAWLDQAIKFLDECKDDPLRAAWPVVEITGYAGEKLYHPTQQKGKPDDRVLLKGKYGYLADAIKHETGGNTITYAVYPDRAKVMTRDEAEKLQKEFGRGLKIVSASIKDDYDPHVIRFSNGWYVHVRSNSSKIAFADGGRAVELSNSVKRFRNLAAAQKYVARLQQYLEKNKLTAEIIAVKQ